MTDTDQKREDEVLKRMLAMPPKPHKEKGADANDKKRKALRTPD